jgi:tetratricopeptide (TPR) repeat protein
MTTEILYERYKDALRRGHVAALRGRTDEAIGAYAEAISLAPDRPLAHISRAGVLVKVGRFDEALTGYERALRLAPREVAALGGRAEALARLGRRTDAAEAFDYLADIHEAAGRTAEACDTARRALEQAESKARRRHIEDLTIKLREAVGDQAAEQALARALHVLEEMAPASPRAPAAAPAEPATAAAADAGPEAPEAIVEPPPDVLVLALEAEEALDLGDLATARDRLLSLAAAHQAAGRYAAALDACYGALAVAPSDTNLHLALVDLYLARGWRTPAADKLLLLSHLIELDGDGPARERLCSVIASRFPDDPKLVAVCA